jgi:acyl carrier protein
MPEPLDFDRFRALIAQQLDVEPAAVTAEKSFTEDLEADSLDIVELVMLLEEEYGFQISDDEAEKLGTVGQAWDYVRSRQAEAVPS